MFDVVDLLWGTLNNFQDTLASNSGDPRRDDARNYLNAALNRTYGRNILQDVHGFYGIVFAALDSFQVETAQKEGLLRDYAKMPREPNDEMRTAYKVYIPEIEPSPPPKSASDPILWFYPNIFPRKDISTQQQLGLGTIVRVEYQDMQNLIEPTIVSVEGRIELELPAKSTGGLAFKFKESVPVLGAMGVDPGEYSWSNRAKQKRSLYLPTNQMLLNGELESLGLLEDDPETGAQLLPGAMIDFKKMNAAFKKKFGKSLVVSGGYRSYEGQVRTRMVRVLGDRAGCPGKATGKRAGVSSSGKLGEGIGQWTYEDGACIFRGYAATPGTSKHGWGGAVDLSGVASSAAQFKWLNKFGPDNFNFVFGVEGEKWHLNWLGLKDVLQDPPTSGFTRWTPEGVDDEKITLA
jgi:hypothetical protein